MDNIFSYVVSKDQSNRRTIAYIGWMIDTFPKTEFDSDSLLFWHFLDFCNRLSVIPKYKYMETWIETDMKKLMLNDSIKVPGCETISFTDPAAFETAFRVTRDVMLDNYKVLESLDSPLEDFPVAVAKFMSTKKLERLTECLSTTFEIMSETNDPQQAAEYNLMRINQINAIYDEDCLDDLREITEDPDSDKEHMVFVTDFCLPAINQDSHGLFKKQLLGIEAQPGTGKTRFQININYRAATLYKQNVAIYSLEQDASEFKAMLVAMHVFTLFGKIVNDELIVKNIVPEELVPYVTAARLDLFESGKYGKIFIKSEEFYVESFVGNLKTDDNMHGPFDMVTIDYMGMLESMPAKYGQHLDETAIISRGYRLFKRYCRKCNKAGIAVAQLNRTGIAAGEADKEITPDMAQGGISVYRNTDYNVAISATAEMKARQQRRFRQPKVRSTTGFGSFMTDTKLGICMYQQVVRKEV